MFPSFHSENEQISSMILNPPEFPPPLTPSVVTPKRKSRLPFVFSSLVILTGIFLFSSSLLLGLSKSKTALSQGIAERRQAELAKVLGAQTEETSRTFRSETAGFQLEYDPAFWYIEAQNKNEVTLVLKKQYGSAIYSLEKLENFASLDEAVDGVIRENKSLVGKLLEKQYVKYHGQDAFRLSYQQTILGNELTYSQFVLRAQGGFYLVTERVSTLLNSQAHLNALSSSLLFISPTAAKQVLAATTSDTGSALDETKITALVKPSVVNIVHLYCQTINITEKAVYIKPSYKICSGMKGSGFIVDEAGYVATNGHVIKVYPEEMMILSFIDGQVAPFLIDLIKELSAEQGNILTDEQALAVLGNVVNTPGGEDMLLSAMYTLYDKKILTIEDNGSKYFVNMGNQPFQIDDDKIKNNDVYNAVSVSTGVLSARLVAVDFPNSFTSKALAKEETPAGSDVGLLKVDNPSGYLFPALKLGDSSSLKEGNQVLVVGFPGLVSGTSEGGSLLSYESSVEATITKGIISSIKSAKDGKKLFQTDASIDHGNSGGPAFNEQGEVVGVATYGFQSSSGNFNFLRDISDLKALMSGNNVSGGESSLFGTWRFGLDQFWASKFKKALPLFNGIKSDYPIHPTVDEYIADSQTAIANGQDKSGFFSSLPMIGSISSIYLIGGFAGLVLVIVGISVAIIVSKKGKESEVVQPATVVNIPAQEVPTSPASYQPANMPSTAPNMMQTPPAGIGWR